MSSKNAPTGEKFKSKIGGQALIEGIMMLGPNKGAMACRLPDGSIDLETWEENNGKNAPWYKKTPLVRGCVSVVTSMIKGYKYMMKAADKQIPEDEKDEDSSLTSIFMMIGVFLGIAIAVGLFVFLPKFVVGLIKPLTSSRIIRSLAEGLMKILIFVGYMALTGLMKDIRRQYMYHGAEHKTIACHEAELPLTVENVRRQTRFHKRCGTSFIFISLFISIFVFCFITWSSMAARMALQIVLLPVIVGISYELIRLAGRYDNAFTRIISAPGLNLQRLTTREPDEKQIEVAIAAIKPCIPENKEDDRW